MAGIGRDEMQAKTAFLVAFGPALVLGLRLADSALWLSLAETGQAQGTAGGQQSSQNDTA
jgi:hypothetical protein